MELTNYPIITKVKMTDEQYARMKEAQFSEHRKLVAIASRLLFLTDLAKKEYEERDAQRAEG